MSAESKKNYLGIDVGGTHTDAVAVSEDGVQAFCKVPTDKDNLLESVNRALESILDEVGPDSVSQLNLSTTLSTNAIVENTTEEVGMIVSSGPGMDPDNYMLCKNFHPIGGALDHRGTETRALDRRELQTAMDQCREQGIKVYGAVSKFSTRNPSHENAMNIGLKDQSDFTTLGHHVSGALNFPRRIATAYFNSAVWRLYNKFADAMEKSVEKYGLSAKVNVLKADGGTIPMALSRRIPVQSIFSGPAASVMGVIALCDPFHDSIIFDVGGTTTDIAIFISGAPLIEPEGISIGSHPTLVRALKVMSIGIGGDSAISVLGDTVRVGPNRLGPSIAAGGDHPTLTDAMNFLGMCQFGDYEKSKRELAAFAQGHSLEPEFLAQAAVDYAVDKIYVETKQFLYLINEKPVYTIHELLEGRKIVPRKIYLMGGPAEALKEPVFKMFKLSTTVPENPGVANAVGAALTRTTSSIELFADTEKGTMLIPALGHRENVPRDYNVDQAEKDAVNHLYAHLKGLGAKVDLEDIQVTGHNVFNMVSGMYTVGRNIRIKCQIKPGVFHYLRP